MNLELLYWLRLIFLGGLFLVVLILGLYNVIGNKKKN
jgi:hypothetical protein